MRALYGMKINLLIFGISTFINVTCFAENYFCEADPFKANERSFTASIDLDKDFVTVTALTLSEDWPLSDECDSPVGLERLKLNRNKNVREISFGPYSGKQCSYFFILNNEDSDVALLFPVRGSKVYGERPYLAKCNAI